MFCSGDERDTKMTDFDNVLYFTGDATTAATVDSTRDDEVQIKLQIFVVHPVLCV